MTELPWIAEARSYIGLHEIRGMRHAPEIIAMLNAMKHFSPAHEPWWHDDDTPWCGLFVGYCLGQVGRYVVPAWYRAASWAEHDSLTELDHPAYGCIAVFSRRGGGHVGFVVGKDAHGNLMILGGNQSDAVNIKPFARSRVCGYFWPAYWQGGKAVASKPNADRYNLPILTSNGQLSTDER